MGSELVRARAVRLHNRKKEKNMDSAGKHHVEHLETQITRLSHSLRSLATGDDVESLIPIIRRPGWTTPAEFTLVTGLVDSMIEQAQNLQNLKQALVKGSREVGLQ
jgi:hypothetical protein